MQTNTPAKCIDITSTSSSNDNVRSHCPTVVSAVPVPNPERYVANVQVRSYQQSQPTHPSNYTSNRAEHNIKPTTSKQNDTVFVVGDFMTKVLSPVKLSDSRVKVTELLDCSDLKDCSSNMFHVFPHCSNSKSLDLLDCSDLPDCSSNMFHVFQHCSNTYL